MGALRSLVASMKGQRRDIKSARPDEVCPDHLWPPISRKGRAGERGWQIVLGVTINI